MTFRRSATNFCKMHLPLQLYHILIAPPLSSFGSISELWKYHCPGLLRIKQQISQSSVKAVTSKGKSQGVLQAVKTIVSAIPGLFCSRYLPFVAKTQISQLPLTSLSRSPLLGLSPNCAPIKLNSQLSGYAFFFFLR